MGGWTEVSPLDVLPDGRGVLVEIGTERLAVFRLGGEALAVADRCSHAEASLAEGEVFDRRVECPRHGAEFDLETGAALSLPATRAVAAYPTRVEEGHLYVRLDPEEEA